jgi:hypothetical protein
MLQYWFYRNGKNLVALVMVNETVDIGVILQLIVFVVVVMIV